jgi:hypothetical protein
MILDEGLEDTFPATDPPATMQPGHALSTAEDRDQETR